MKKKDLQFAFNGVAGNLPGTAFSDYLRETFGAQTARKVLGTFERMGLPAPECAGEFLKGAEGALVFASRYGMVIRIEDREPRKGLGYVADRINDNPWIAQPIATVRAGRAVVELCGGMHLETNTDNNAYLTEQLSTHNVAFKDDGIRNVGRLPVRTPLFPEGIPIVIDRLSVLRIEKNAKRIGNAIQVIEEFYHRNPKNSARAAARAQGRLYAPLREGFLAGWMFPQKMPLFWELCQTHVREGKLIAGWNERGKRECFVSDNPYTVDNAYYSSLAYEKRLSAGRTIRPSSSAVPQSPRSPA